MKIKVQDLTLLQLDWAVAVANESEDCREPKVARTYDGVRYIRVTTFSGVETDWEPTTDASQSWPIIESEGIKVVKAHPTKSVWASEYPWGEYESEYFGKTSLEAAMRCFVASKLGDEVDIPEELL